MRPVPSQVNTNEATLIEEEKVYNLNVMIKESHLPLYSLYDFSPIKYLSLKEQIEKAIWFAKASHIRLNRAYNGRTNKGKLLIDQ